MSKGQHPLDCRNILFTPAGAMSGTLGDIDVISHDGKIHLFHLVLPNHDAIGHAVSADGFYWETADDALRTGGKGCFDDDMLWTMQVVRHPEKELFLMYYTACSRREHGQVQRIGLAVSEDLISWQRYSDAPLLEAEGSCYHADLHRVGFVSFRDPFVFVDDAGEWHMLFTARTRESARFRSGCVGHATSRDGFSWNLQQPVFSPKEYEDLEVPSLVSGPRFQALFFNIFGRGVTECRIAPSLNGPWRRPKRNQPLPDGHFVWRFCEWNGRQLLFNTFRTEADWPRRYCPAGSAFNVLAPPRELAWDRSGEPMIQSFSGWESLAAEDWREWSEEETGPCDAGWHWNGRKLEFNGIHRGEALSREDFGHFILECRVEAAEARKFGFVLKSDENGEERLAVEFDSAAMTAEIHKVRILRPSVPRLKIKVPTLHQRAAFPVALSDPARIRIIVCGEYIEVSVDGRVILSDVSHPREHGRLGFFASEGRAGVEGIRTLRLNPPWQEF